MSSLTVRRARLVFIDGLRGLKLAYGLFILIMALIFATIGLVIHATDGFGASPWTSVFEQAQYGTRYFPLSMGAIVAIAFLPVAVAHGVTRRSYVLGSAALVVTLSVVVGAFLAAGHGVEYLLFDAAGAVQDFSSPHLFSSGRQVGWVFVESLVVVTANISAGFFVGAAYYKWHWLWATLALPLLLAPLAAVEAVLAAGWPGNVMETAFDVDRGPLGVVLPVSVVLIAAMHVGAFAIFRTTDVRPSAG
jgi:hypothetical protein